MIPQSSCVKPASENEDFQRADDDSVVRPKKKRKETEMTSSDYFKEVLKIENRRLEILETTSRIEQEMIKKKTFYYEMKIHKLRNADCRDVFEETVVNL